MAKNVVTLYIDDSSLRLLVARGKQVKKWATLPLEPGLVKDGVIVNEVNVADRIKELFQTQGVKPGKVIAGLSGLHCLTRPISVPILPRALLAEAVKQEAEKLLPVPVEQLYLSWQSIYTSEGKTYLFIVALPRNSADALVKTLRQAGLNPDIIDIKPLALARVVDEATAIIVDVQPNEFDIVIMAYGIPQPIRTLSLPRNAQTWQQKVPVIAADLDRTIKFYNSSNPGKPLDANLPIYVSGELAHVPEAYQVLTGQLGHPVLPLSSVLKCGSQLDTSHYMVNIGLALKKLSLGKRTAVSVVNLNVLPDVYRPKPIPLAKVLVPASLVLAIGVLGYLVTVVQGAAADADSLQSKLDTTTQLIKQKQTSQKSQRDEITKLEKKVTGLEAAYTAFGEVISSFTKRQEKVNGDLTVSADVLPSTVVLESISRTGADLAISGVSSNETEALAYASALRSSGRFELVTVSSIENSDNGTSFNLNLKAKEE